jgi:O-antigen/teichoic acid export membrane protein
MPRESTPKSLFNPASGEIADGTVVDPQDDLSGADLDLQAELDIPDKHSAGLLSTGRQRWQFAYTVGVAFAIVVLQMAQGILLARLLGAVGRGEYAASVLYVQMTLYIGLLGGLEVICRRAADKTGDRMRLRRAALWLGITTGTITTLVCVVLCITALPADKRYLMPMALVCSLSIIGQHVMLIMTAVDRGSGQFGAYNVRRVIAAAAFPALLLVAASILKITLPVTCLLFVAASLVSMGACLVGVESPFRSESEPKVPMLLKESRPYAISMIATDLFERLDLLLMLWLVPLLQQGFYAAMVPVAYPLTVIPNTLGLFLFNAGANRQRNLSTRDIHRILGLSLTIQTASTIVFWLTIGPVVRFLYGEEFAPAVAFAMWLAPISAIKGILQGLDSYLKGRGRPLAPIRCRIVAAVIMLIVTWLLIDQYGAFAIAIAALVGQVFCLIWLSAIVYLDVHEKSPA